MANDFRGSSGRPHSPDDIYFSNEYPFDEYQQGTNDTAEYPDAGTGSDTALNYVIVAAAGEAGEIANKWKKVLRGDRTSTEARDSILGEVRGALWYITRICTEYGTTVAAQADQNIAELYNRKSRNVIRGDGDNR